MKIWRNNGGQRVKTVMMMMIASLLAACEATLGPNLPGLTVQPQAGGVVVADEPQAVLLTRDILNAGGSAADAAVTLGFGLSVTLQSRAGLGGGGVCLVYDADTGRAEVLDFGPVAATGNQNSARWQVSVPTLARGLFALHAKYGRLPWQQVVVPAENLIRFQNVVSRALAQDLSGASASLINDPRALDTFMVGRKMAEEGSRLQQLDLAATMGRIRGRTPGDFYNGAFARTIERSAASTGASLSASDLRQYAPEWRSAESARLGRGVVYSIGPPVKTGSSAETETGHDRTASSTGYVVADADGNVVACSLTMVSPFGNGLMPDGLGFLLTPSPELANTSTSELTSTIAVEAGTRTVLYAAASGGAGAEKHLSELSRVVLGESQTLSEFQSNTRANDGASYPSINAFYCARGLQQDIRACQVEADPRGNGYGLIALGER